MSSEDVSAEPPEEAKAEGNVESEVEVEVEVEVEAEAEAMGLKEKGNLAIQELHYSEAAALYSEALGLLPENTALLCNRALAYIKLESYGLAILDASNAISLDGSCAKAYYRRGTAQFALNKTKQARKDFRQVCKLKPKDRDARAKLAACEKAVKEAAFAAAIQSEETVPLSDRMDPSSINIEAGYDGPHPAGGEKPLPPDTDEECDLFQPGRLPLHFVKASMQRFKDQKLIHKRYVARLLINCKRYFQTLPSLMELPFPPSADNLVDNDNANDTDANDNPTFTVCGDTHGQYYDVLNIFDFHGLPSKTHPYLFNGDFVDRGSFSVEVILTYLLLKMSCPQSIYLTRGNHETKNMNKIYGFEGEVKAKYDEVIFELFLEVFAHLPLAAVIGTKKKVFVTHGGLPTEPGVTLQDIQKIKRGCEPADSGYMSDLMWADPQPFPGRSPSKRGVGYSFGPDITEKFLQSNGLELLIRSHEVKDEGYLVEHGGKTITVFSAPNYCDYMGNKGALITFKDEDMEPHFTKFSAVEHPDVKPMAYAAGMGSLF